MTRVAGCWDVGAVVRGPEAAGPDSCWQAAGQGCQRQTGAQPTPAPPRPAPPRPARRPQERGAGGALDPRRRAPRQLLARQDGACCAGRRGAAGAPHPRHACLGPACCAAALHTPALLCTLPQHNPTQPPPASLPPPTLPTHPQVRCWDAATGEQLKKMGEHKDIVNSCCPLRRGPPLLVSAGDDCEAKLWDLRAKRSVKTFTERFQVRAGAGRGWAIVWGGVCVWGGGGGGCAAGRAAWLSPSPHAALGRPTLAPADTVLLLQRGRRPDLHRRH